MEEMITAEDINDSLLEMPVNGSNGDGILNRPIDEGVDLPELIGTVAKHYLRQALEAGGGNKTTAAELVGLGSYQTLSNWLKRYDVEQ